jgi:hypothetical protein
LSPLDVNGRLGAVWKFIIGRVAALKSASSLPRRETDKQAQGTLDNGQALLRGRSPLLDGSQIGRAVLAGSGTPSQDNTRMPMDVSVLSLDRANTVYSIALFALIFGAMISMIAVAALIWAIDVRNRFTNAQLATVTAQSDQAKLDAARASQRMAELLLQTQKARVEQEKLRLEREQMRSLSAWRQVSHDQHDKIVNALRGHSLTVNLLIAGDDPEAAQFGEDIARTLRDAGASVSTAAGMFPVPIRGLGMTLTKSDAGTALYMALHGAGFEIKDLPEREPPMIVVGRKPAAF